MQQVLGVLLLLFSFSVLATEHHVPFEAEDHGPNIPTVGSSLFDKIYSKKNSSGEMVYDIPYPLTNFVDKLAENDGRVVHSLFPFSRSLQRPIDLSFDPLLNPRLVFTATEEATGLVRGRLFFGFVKAKDQLEVISFNDEAGRYEYQVIADYSKDPKVFYVDRGKCLSCHQGQAGIFSVPGWQDSNIGPMRHLLYEKLGVQGDEFEKRRKAFTKLFGPVDSDDQVATFDTMVRDSESIALAQRTWVHGCGDDAKCRLGILVNTLSRNSSQATALVNYAKDVVSFSQLKNDGITFKSVLSSTDIGTSKTIVKYGTVKDVIDNPQAILEIISNLYNLSTNDNPATKRPFPLYNQNLIRPLLAFNYIDFNIISEAIPSPNGVSEILIELYEEKHPVFEKKAMNKIAIMHALLEKAGSPKAKNYSHWLNKQTPEKELFAGGFTPVFKKAELNILSRYCQKCHATGLSFPPQFLVGTEDEVVDKITNLKYKMTQKIRDNLMPPNIVDQYNFEKTGDRDRVLKFLKTL